MTSIGAMIGGYYANSDFEIRAPEGAVMRVVRRWDPVPVDPEGRSTRRALPAGILQATRA